jgi:hypothetical protein
MGAGEKKTALWIRLDIPNAEDANLMKGVLGYRQSGPGEAGVATLVVQDCVNIPETVDKLLAAATAAGIHAGGKLTLVYPLDPRHGLAWTVKDAADKRGWEFSRHVPEAEAAKGDAYVPFWVARTGSADDGLDQAAAQEKVFSLNRQGYDCFSSGMDLLEAMGYLRHALQLCHQHLGLRHPAAVYTVRNLMATLRATGNHDNELDGLAVAAAVACAWDKGAADKESWDQAARGLLADIVKLCADLNDPELAARWQGFADQLG